MKQSITKLDSWYKNKAGIYKLSIGEKFVFNTASFAAEILFGDRNLGKNILKHITRGTSYKNYLFERALYKTP